MAKGICYARDLKLLAIPTLELLCVPVLLKQMIPEDDALLCPMLDARRMEVYTALYDRALRPVREVAPLIVDANSFKKELEEHPVVFFGNGAAKCKDVISHRNAIFIDEIKPLAKYMLPLADKAIAQGKSEDVAYFEPFYLKDFIAGTSKKLF
jgi:tRNA threonylcarbamoyladenosine biosynthesis protein TsaB